MKIDKDKLIKQLILNTNSEQLNKAILSSLESVNKQRAARERRELKSLDQRANMRFSGWYW